MIDDDGGGSGKELGSLFSGEFFFFFDFLFVFFFILQSFRAFSRGSGTAASFLGELS